MKKILCLLQLIISSLLLKICQLVLEHVCYFEYSVYQEKYLQLWGKPRGLMCYERVGMSDSAEKSVYYPQFYDHKSHMKGEVYNDSHGDVYSGCLDPFVSGRDR